MTVEDLHETSNEVNKKELRRLFTPSKILLNHLQLVNIFFLFKVDWPNDLLRFMDWLRIVLYLDFVSLASPECALGNFSHWTRVLADACAPLTFVFVFFGVFMYAWMSEKHPGRWMLNEEKAAKYSNQSLVSMVVIALLSFIGGTQLAFEQFACKSLDTGETRLNVAYEVNCSNNADYMRFIVSGIVIAFVYVMVINGSLLLVVADADKRKTDAVQKMGFEKPMRKRTTTLALTPKDRADRKAEFEQCEILGFSTRIEYSAFKKTDDYKEFNDFLTLDLIRTKAEFDAVRANEEVLDTCRGMVAALADVLKNVEEEEPEVLQNFRNSNAYLTAKKERVTLNPFDNAAETIAGEFRGGEFEDAFKWWFLVAQLMKLLAVIAELFLDSGRAQLIFMLVVVSMCLIATFQVRPYEHASEYILEVTLQLIQLVHLSVAFLMYQGFMGKSDGAIWHIALVIVSAFITVLALSEKWRTFAKLIEKSFDIVAKKVKIYILIPLSSCILGCIARIAAEAFVVACQWATEKSQEEEDETEFLPKKMPTGNGQVYLSDPDDGLMIDLEAPVLHDVSTKQNTETGIQGESNVEVDDAGGGDGGSSKGRHSTVAVADEKSSASATTAAGAAKAEKARLAAVAAAKVEEELLAAVAAAKAEKELRLKKKEEAAKREAEARAAEREMKRLEQVKKKLAERAAEEKRAAADEMKKKDEARKSDTNDELRAKYVELRKKGDSTERDQEDEGMVKLAAMAVESEEEEDSDDDDDDDDYVDNDDEENAKKTAEARFQAEEEVRLIAERKVAVKEEEARLAAEQEAAAVDEENARQFKAATEKARFEAEEEVRLISLAERKAVAEEKVRQLRVVEEARVEAEARARQKAKGDAQRRWAMVKVWAHTKHVEQQAREEKEKDRVVKKVIAEIEELVRPKKKNIKVMGGFDNQVKVSREQWKNEKTNPKGEKVFSQAARGAKRLSPFDLYKSERVLELRAELDSAGLPPIQVHNIFREVYHLPCVVCQHEYQHEEEKEGHEILDDGLKCKSPRRARHSIESPKGNSDRKGTQALKRKQLLAAKKGGSSLSSPRSTGLTGGGSGRRFPSPPAPQMGKELGQPAAPLTPLDRVLQGIREKKRITKEEGATRSGSSGNSRLGTLL
jgi:hypothetical protein